MFAKILYKNAIIPSETHYIYALLAQRFGFINIKTKLEDLGLKYTEPDVYNDILSKTKESKEEQNAYIESITSVLNEALEKEFIDFTIKGRPKSIYSIRRKMKAQGVTFDQVYDKF